nr:2-amino-4-hydroxy-6-hydroxymethyldihydropteridine diphosphokinase [Parvularcula maris]
MIGLGSNKPFLGRSCEEVMRGASAALSSLGTDVVLSPLYRSPAWPDPSQPPYVNAVARLETALSPEALLTGLQAIEAGFGRVRHDDPALRYAPRTLDLDLLALGGEVREGEALSLPHPRLAERDFVLLPLRDVASEWVHPLTGEGAEEMLARLSEVTATKTVIPESR